MVRRGLATLDEVEEAERQESAAVAAVQAFDAVDWASFIPSLSDSVVDPSFLGFDGSMAAPALAGQGSSSRTPITSPSSEGS